MGSGQLLTMDGGAYCSPGTFRGPQASGAGTQPCFSVSGLECRQNVITIATITGMSIILSVSRCVIWFFQLISLESRGGAVPGPDSHS